MRKKTEPQNNIPLPSTYLRNTNVSNANSSLDISHTTSSFMTQLSDPTTKTLSQLISTHNHPSFVSYIFITTNMKYDQINNTKNYQKKYDSINYIANCHTL